MLEAHEHETMKKDHLWNLNLHIMWPGSFTDSPTPASDIKKNSHHIVLILFVLFLH